ncbi:MAG: 2OG-Fe(II) oxygenase, partial [Acidobacteriota bacterium]|nr:2OG-Fe(II) oxygenase [Acidobacteriota bacterium]
MQTATLTRRELAGFIAHGLAAREETLREEFHVSGRVASFAVDSLFPEEIARRIFDAFPPNDRLVRKKNLGQDKFVGAQMNLYDPILEETVYSFQEPEVVKLVSSITGIGQLIPDRDLYAGGISVMCHGNFLNPHLDNSHDKDQKNYRVLNLLYYATPGWKEEFGGNLELWDQGPEGPRRTMVSAFNRLAVMITNKSSWHSVSPVQAEGRRCCVSNYYFSPEPVDDDASYHVTSFRGRPG